MNLQLINCLLFRWLDREADKSSEDGWGNSLESLQVTTILSEESLPQKLI